MVGKFWGWFWFGLVFFLPVSVISIRRKGKGKKKQNKKQHISNCVNSKATEHTAEDTVMGNQSNFHSHLCTYFEHKISRKILTRWSKGKLDFGYWQCLVFQVIRYDRITKEDEEALRRKYSSAPFGEVCLTSNRKGSTDAAAHRSCGAVQREPEVNSGRGEGLWLWFPSWQQWGRVLALLCCLVVFGLLFNLVLICGKSYELPKTGVRGQNSPECPYGCVTVVSFRLCTLWITEDCAILWRAALLGCFSAASRCFCELEELCWRFLNKWDFWGVQW